MTPKAHLTAEIMVAPLISPTYSQRERLFKSFDILLLIEV
jgi:hypothetical protein